MFLAGEDNFAALEAELAQIFGLFLFVCLLHHEHELIASFPSTAEKKNETTKKQLDRLAKESDLMMREFAELGNGVVSSLSSLFLFLFTIP